MSDKRSALTAIPAEPRLAQPLHRPSGVIEGKLGEPWVVLPDASELEAWGRDEEIAYNQINRQTEKALFFRRTFDFLTD